MDSSLTTLIGFCLVLALIQVLAAVPWLLVIDPRLKTRWKDSGTWGPVLIGILAAGAIGGYFLNGTGEAMLKASGAIYASILQLQLLADLFVGIFALVLAVWSKGGAVALSAFREAVRQPMFWMLTGAALCLMAASPIIPYFTFGEDLKMVREMCYAFTMIAAAFFSIISASVSVSEEIEGRTAVTLMSKPLSRRQFLLGKFGGILLAALVMTVILGWAMIWVFRYKIAIDAASPIVQTPPDPAWVQDAASAVFGTSSSTDLLYGILKWSDEVSAALPNLVIGFCQVMVLLAISIALATRVPMVVNVVVCVCVYFLGHLTPIMTAVSQNQYALVYFVAQVFDVLLPGLDLFDVATAIVRETPLPPVQYAMYTLNVGLYAVIYTSIALLFGLILFEDRDLA